MAAAGPEPEPDTPSWTTTAMSRSKGMFGYEPTRSPIESRPAASSQSSLIVAEAPCS